MSKSKNGNGHAGSGVFGSPERVLVKRALAEFRSRRPVMFSSQNGKFLIALPVDGLDAARLHAFEHLCEPAKPKPRRDGAPCALARHRGERSGVARAAAGRRRRGDPVARRGCAARTSRPKSMARTDSSAAPRSSLAKIAHRLPALLIAEVDSPASALIEPPLVVVAADAVMKFRPRRSAFAGNRERSECAAAGRDFDALRGVPRLHRRRLRRGDRRRSGSLQAGAGAAAFRLPDRRRVRLEPLRLRRPAPSCAPSG